MKMGRWRSLFFALLISGWADPLLSEASSAQSVLPIPYPPAGGRSGSRGLTPPPAFISPTSEQGLPLSVPPPVPTPGYSNVSVDCGIYPGTRGVAINRGYACLTRPIDNTPTAIPLRANPNCSQYAGARAFHIPGGVICLQR
ncbi:MAG: hypothetical protein KME35_05055 [Aphanocapsa sp. GSE-SYN-MK-11-07L]|jgi:hypothetical protein|nr:hypothetical protein [Aphanocapsa sp. GSE-SYN-MK-11-07L]